MKPDSIITPLSLKKGDTIAICSPAGTVNPEFVHGAATTIEREGFTPLIMPSALGQYCSFSAPADKRLADMAQAFLRPDVRAILCSRGGYGAIHLLPDLAAMHLPPKWLIGFSDISALHALMLSKGIASIHASMARIMCRGNDNPENRQLFDILGGNCPVYTWSCHPLSVTGQVSGRILGGNLSVLGALQATPFDIFNDAEILFLEDINEPIYKIDRMMRQLQMRGVLSRLKGIILGRFTGATPSRSYTSAYDAIAPLVAPLGIPVAFGAPIGHEDLPNIPIVEGANVRFSVDDNLKASLQFL